MHHVTLALPLTCMLCGVMSQCKKTFERCAYDMGKGHGAGMASHWSFAVIITSLCGDSSIDIKDRLKLVSYLIDPYLSPLYVRYCSLNEKQMKSWNTRARSRLILRIVFPARLQVVWTHMWDLLQTKGVCLLPQDKVDEKFWVRYPLKLPSSHWTMLSAFLYAVYHYDKFPSVPRLLIKYSGDERIWVSCFIQKHLFNDVEDINKVDFSSWNAVGDARDPRSSTSSSVVPPPPSPPPRRHEEQEWLGQASDRMSLLAAPSKSCARKRASCDVDKHAKKHCGQSHAGVSHPHVQSARYQ